VAINAAMALESTLNFDFILLVATLINFVLLDSISTFLRCPVIKLQIYCHLFSELRKKLNCTKFGRDTYSNHLCRASLSYTSHTIAAIQNNGNTKLTGVEILHQNCRLFDSLYNLRKGIGQYLSDFVKFSLGSNI